MRELEGRSCKEIAETLSLSVSAVEALLFRARRRLQVERKALGVLGTAPLPGSLTSALGIGGGGGGAAATGLAALGGDAVLKAATALVVVGAAASGVVAFTKSTPTYRPAAPPAATQTHKAVTQARAKRTPTRHKANRRLRARPATTQTATQAPSGGGSSTQLPLAPAPPAVELPKLPVPPPPVQIPPVQLPALP